MRRREKAIAAALGVGRVVDVVLLIGVQQLGGGEDELVAAQREETGQPPFLRSQRALLRPHSFLGQLFWRRFSFDYFCCLTHIVCNEKLSFTIAKLFPNISVERDRWREKITLSYFYVLKLGLPLIGLELKGCRGNPIEGKGQ